MRNPVRKFVGLILMGVLASLFVLPMLSAGAQTTTTLAVASDCSFSVTGTYPNFTVAGTAPTDSNVTLYFTPLGGTQAAQGTQPGPSFSFPFVAPGEGDISVGYVRTDGSAYTAACATVAGEVVVRVRPSSTPVNPNTGANNAAALAFTGSSDTPSYVLIGIAAIVVGAVLVIAARRRSHLS